MDLNFFWGMFLYVSNHAIACGLMMYFVIAYLERNRTPGNKAYLALLAVLPAAILGVIAMAIPSLLNINVFSAVKHGMPLATFLALWLIGGLPLKQAGVMAAIYLVISYLVPFLLQALGKLFEPLFHTQMSGIFGPSFLILAILVTLLTIGICVLVNRDRPLSRVIISFIVAALIAPTLVVGHGAAIVPAALAWPMVFAGGVNGLIALAMVLVPVLILGTIFVVVASRIGKRPDAQH